VTDVSGGHLRYHDPEPAVQYEHIAYIRYIDVKNVPEKFFLKNV